MVIPMNETTKAKLTDVVLNHLANSTTAGKESISFLVSTLRDKGFKIPGQREDMVDTLASLGFKIEREMTKSGFYVKTTFVTV